MNTWLKQLRAGQLWESPGGIHPPENKVQSSHLPIAEPFLPTQLVLPLKQHHGQTGKRLVSPGDKVLKGQPLTAAENRISAPVHAPTSGTVVAIEPRIIAHPSGLSEPCLILQPDGQDQWGPLQPQEQWHRETADQLRDRIRQAGITGLGGASFPTAVKLDPPYPIQVLVINGAECEPYITADDVLMRAHAAQIVSGIAIMAHVLQPKLVIIAIEDNKPEAIEAFDEICQRYDYLVRSIPSKYPSGGERQLIQIVTGKEVPSGSLPADIGVVVQNVGTAFAVHQAIVEGKPLIQRVVTVTGERVAPHNRWVLLGTPVDQVLGHSDYRPQGRQRVVMGGPMMGFTLPSLNAPVVKATNCLLVPSQEELPPPGSERPCIRCSHCVPVCPAGLLPQQLYWFARAQDHDRAQAYRLQDCIECGACAWVCPSHIPLVQYYRQAKAEIRAEAEELARSEYARQRFEARQHRMEREKEERAQRHKQSMARQRQKRAQAGEAADNAVAAALARVKARKQAAASKEPPAADNSTVITEPNTARETQVASKTQQSAEQDSRKAAVADAIARAKARKAAQQAQSNSQDKKQD